MKVRQHKMTMKEYKVILPLLFRNVQKSEKLNTDIQNVLKEYESSARISRSEYSKENSELFLEIVVDSNITKELILRKLEEVINN